MSEPTTKMQISGIGQIAVNVHDLKRAKEFYRDILGMRFLFEAGNMAFFDCGGIRLMLAPPDKPELDHPGSILYYRVPDISEAFEFLSSRGVAFEEKPAFVARLSDHDLWLAFFRDPENNLLGLMSEMPLAK